MLVSLNAKSFLVLLCVIKKETVRYVKWQKSSLVINESDMFRWNNDEQNYLRLDKETN